VSTAGVLDHFTAREDAFLVAYEVGTRPRRVAMADMRTPVSRNGVGAVRAADLVLFEFLAEEPSFAQ